MWVDERGSVVLDRPECRRLLALGAKHHLHGHLAISTTGAPLVVPLDYVVRGPDVVVCVGQALFERIMGAQLVAFQVDVVEEQTPWSVLVRGLAIAEDRSSLGGHLPHPRVALPGDHFVRIRSDVVTGRRLDATVLEHLGVRSERQ